MFKDKIEQKKECDFDEIRQKDQESFMALVEKIADLEDDSVRMTQVSHLIEKILIFYDEYSDEQSFFLDNEEVELFEYVLRSIFF